MAAVDLAHILAALFPALVLFAAVRDLTTMTIPNRVTLLAAAAFAPAALAAGLSPMAWGVALATGAAAFAVGVVMFALRWIGGGDAKLFAACGLWLGGVTAAGAFLMWTGLAGGLLAIALLGGRRVQEIYAFAGPAWLRRLMTRGEGVPYGVAIAAGALAAFPESPLMAALRH